MRLPNAEWAIIARDKLCDYLLNVEHPRGGSKARLLARMGYRVDDWQRLESDLRQQHLAAEVAAVVDTDYGQRFEIVAPLTGPAGLTIPFLSVWQIDLGADVPRLITMYRSDAMAFPLYQDVILTVDLAASGLCAGDVGTVVEHHAVPGMEDGYSVEFFDMTGQTVAVVTVPGRQLRAPTPADRPTTRTLASTGA